MPRYDYQCNSCGYEFELTQTFKEAGSGTCPDCSGEGRRVYHAVPVIYKGSGFYTTDYGRPKAKVDNTKEGTESKSSSDGKSSSDSKSSTESKSTTSSEAKSESTSTSTTKEAKT